MTQRPCLLPSTADDPESRADEEQTKGRPVRPPRAPCRYPALAAYFSQLIHNLDVRSPATGESDRAAPGQRRRFDPRRRRACHRSAQLAHHPHDTGGPRFRGLATCAGDRAAVHGGSAGRRHRKPGGRALRDESGWPTSGRSSTTHLTLGSYLKTPRMLTHYSAGAIAEYGALARYLYSSMGCSYTSRTAMSDPPASPWGFDFHRRYPIVLVSGHVRSACSRQIRSHQRALFRRDSRQ